MLTRRGFIGTLLAGAVGAAAGFDPLKRLWLPVPLEPTTAITEIVTPEMSWTKAVVDQQLELRDLAARFAKAMTPHLASHKALLIRDVTFADLAQAPAGKIVLDDGRRGHFQPAHHRIAKTLQLGNTLEDVAYDTARELSRKFDAVVPIGTELRAGVPFTDCLVETGADLESGVVARALRFKTPEGVQTMFEIAVGDWHPESRRGEQWYRQFREV